MAWDLRCERSETAAVFGETCRVWIDSIKKKVIY